MQTLKDSLCIFANRRILLPSTFQDNVFSPMRIVPFYIHPITTRLHKPHPTFQSHLPRRHLCANHGKMLGHLAVHYTRLGLHPSATRAELAAAYRAAALKHHPDKGGSASAFAEIKESYEILDRYSGPRVYQPASLRYAHHRGGDWDGIWGILGSVVLPTAVGLGVGIRLMYVGGERGGLRAGGTSRISPQPNSNAVKRVKGPGLSTSPRNGESSEKHPVT